MFLANMRGTVEMGDANSSQEQRILEDELSLQLDLLKHDVPPAPLYVENAATDHVLMEPVKGKGSSTWMMLDEGTLEAAVFCAALAVVFAAPLLLDP